MSRLQHWRKAAGQWLRDQLHVRIILPALVTLGLLAYVSSLATARQSGGQIWAILQQTWVLVLALTIPYLACRAYVWHELMEELGIRVPPRQLLVSFAGGEITKSLPAGVYVQNYLLGRLIHFGELSMVRSSMATTAMLGLETLLAIPVILVLGMPGWPWLRLAIIALVALWVVVLVAAWLLVHVAESAWEMPAWLDRGRSIAEEFLEAGRDLVTLRTLKTLVPTAAYMFVYVVFLYAITRAVGTHRVTLLDASAVYAFIVLVIVLIPIPTELGITELSGLSALVAFGIPRSTAAIVMLSLRVLATGMTILVAAAMLLLLREELIASKAKEQDTTLPAE